MLWGGCGWFLWVVVCFIKGVVCLFVFFLVVVVKVVVMVELCGFWVGFLGVDCLCVFC